MTNLSVEMRTRVRQNPTMNTTAHCPSLQIYQYEEKSALVRETQSGRGTPREGRRHRERERELKEEAKNLREMQESVGFDGVGFAFKF